MLRLGSNNSNTLLLNSNNISPTRTSQIPAGKMSCCPRCLQSYENDVAKLEKSLTGDNRSVLPQWLQNAKVDSVGDKKPVSLIGGFDSNIRNRFSFLHLNIFFFLFVSH